MALVHVTTQLPYFGIPPAFVPHSTLPQLDVIGKQLDEPPLELVDVDAVIFSSAPTPVLFVTHVYIVCVEFSSNPLNVYTLLVPLFIYAPKSILNSYFAIPTDDAAVAFKYDIPSSYTNDVLVIVIPSIF